MAKVDLDKLDTELKRWRGEIPLPCDIVESMADELRALRVAAESRPQEQAAGGGWVNWAWACLDAYYLRENIAWPIFAELNDSESWIVMRNGDPIGWDDKDPNVARIMAAKFLYTEDSTALPSPPSDPKETK